MVAKKIYVSPSDQAGNTYAYGNTNEMVQCQKIAGLLVTALERCGFEAKTSYEQGEQAMYNRVKESNAWGADLHLCIHTNAFNTQVTGTRIFFYTKPGRSYDAAKAVYDALAPVTPGKSDNITPKPQFYEMYRTAAPAVYVEAEFHDNVDAAKWIVENGQTIAECVCKGVCNYYGMPYTEAEQEAPKQEIAAMYRVINEQDNRQIGAFRNLDNALNMAKNQLLEGKDVCLTVREE